MQNVWKNLNIKKKEATLLTSTCTVSARNTVSVYPACPSLQWTKKHLQSECKSDMANMLNVKCMVSWYWTDMKVYTQRWTKDLHVCRAAHPYVLSTFKEEWKLKTWKLVFLLLIICKHILCKSFFFFFF